MKHGGDVWACSYACPVCLVPVPPARPISVYSASTRQTDSVGLRWAAVGSEKKRAPETSEV